jgi:GxxExxY protein
MNGDPLAGRIIRCALEVHRELGPGLLESTYQQCLAHEMALQGLSFKKEFPLPVAYKGIRLDCGYRIDFMVENEVVLELKSVSDIAPIHHAQILTYMKLASITTGLLINFNVKLLKQGIKRFKL